MDSLSVSQGGNKHYTDAEELKRQNLKIQKEKIRRAEAGSDEEEEEEGETTTSRPMIPPLLPTPPGPLPVMRTSALRRSRLLPL